MMTIWIYIQVYEKDMEYPTMSTQESTYTLSPKDHVPQLDHVIIESVDTMENYEEAEEAIPRGKMSIGEQKCLEVLRKIFPDKDIRSHVRDHPALKNPKTGRTLELDFYIPSHKLAVEYHGRQHYEYVKTFHRKGVSDLHYQKWKDNFKVDACDKDGIYLITVPYYIHTDNIEQFIMEYIRQSGRV